MPHGEEAEMVKSFPREKSAKARTPSVQNLEARSPCTPTRIRAPVLMPLALFFAFWGRCCPSLLASSPFRSLLAFALVCFVCLGPPPFAFLPCLLTEFSLCCFFVPFPYIRVVPLKNRAHTDALYLARRLSILFGFSWLSFLWVYVCDLKELSCACTGLFFDTHLERHWPTLFVPAWLLFF